MSSDSNPRQTLEYRKMRRKMEPSLMFKFLLMTLAMTVLATLVQSSFFPGYNSGELIDFKRIINLENQQVDAIEWWKKETYYHIYVRSFKDTTGNGQGDLRGIIEKLDYIKSLGIGVIILSPFYQSPMRDAGYDISDYCATNEIYGTMHDIEELIEGVHNRGMHIIVDFVPNHSSDEHKWFRYSERALIDPEKYGKYKDYYVWSNSTRYKHPEAGGRPSNWPSLFGGGTAWRWSPVRKEFYLHQFLPTQPDLNLRCEHVREELKEVARFWLRKGVDGLRIDAVLHFLEDKDLRDEPVRPDWQPHWDPYDKVMHIMTRLREGDSIVKDWHDVANEPEFGGNRIVITEAYDSIQRLLGYYGPSPSERYADMPFNFELMKMRKQTLRPRNIESIIMAWMNGVHGLQWPRESGASSPWSIWVLGNHDNMRLINRVGAKNLDTFLWVAWLLPGVPVLYAGDEYGQIDCDFNKIPQSTLNEGEPTRLIFRAPMAWDDSLPSGNFSSSAQTWLPLSDDYRQNNIAGQLRSQDPTHLRNFLNLQQLRQKYLETVVFGELTFFDNAYEGSRVFAMARYHHRFPSLLALINYDDHYSSNIRLMPTTTDGVVHVVVPERGKIVLINYSSDQNSFSVGQTINIKDLVLGPNQGVVLELEL